MAGTAVSPTSNFINQEKFAITLLGHLKNLLNLVTRKTELELPALFRKLRPYENSDRTRGRYTIL